MRNGWWRQVPLVLDSAPPRDREARLDVINRIYEHVAYVKSGDNTLAAAVAAVSAVTEQPGDDYFVFVLSDAMLEQYNVSPQNLAGLADAELLVWALSSPFLLKRQLK